MRVGIIGGGLMRREAASCFGWFALQNFPVRAELTAVCDLREGLLKWFAQVPTVQIRTKDHHELLASENVDVVYVAVPHHLHEQLYCDVLAAASAMPPKPPDNLCASVPSSPSPPVRGAPSIS